MSSGTSHGEAASARARACRRAADCVLIATAGCLAAALLTVRVPNYANYDAVLLGTSDSGPRAVLELVTSVPNAIRTSLRPGIAVILSPSDRQRHFRVILEQVSDTPPDSASEAMSLLTARGEVDAALHQTVWLRGRAPTSELTSSLTARFARISLPLGSARLGAKLFRLSSVEKPS